MILSGPKKYILLSSGSPERIFLPARAHFELQRPHFYLQKCYLAKEKLKISMR
jgi:hypothetical protein